MREIVPELGEASGSRVVEESALGILLEQRARSAGVAITRDMINEERARLVSLLDARNTNDAPLGEITARVRRERGLGPVRFERLLRRNATLRALIRLGPEYSTRIESEIARALDAASSERARIRLCVLADQRSAERTLSRLAPLEAPAIEWAFASAAMESSVHPSAAAGGLLPRLSLTDPSVSPVILDAAGSLAPRSLSGILETAQGPALVYLAERLPPSPPTNDERDAIEARAVIAAEQLMMEELARAILDDASLIVTDPSLNWSVR